MEGKICFTEITHNNKQTGTIILDDSKEISIDEETIIKYKLLHNDRILYEENNITISSRTDRIYGMLILADKIININNKKILKKFIPIDNRYPEFMVQINKNLQHDTNNKYCSIQFKEHGQKYMIGSIVNIFGNIGDYKKEKTFLKHKYMVVSKNSYQMNEIIDLTPDRKDLTHLLTFSIDPEGCQDIDDAFSVVNNGQYIEIYIHISDVSSYVSPNSDLDNILLNRASSIYLTNEQINMMPEILAINECSLKINKQSRSFTTVFVMDNNGNIISTDSYKSIIINQYNLSYDQAQTMITNDGSLNDEPLNECLNCLYNIGQKLNLLFEEKTYDCHVMVEKMMLLINTHVANVTSKYDPINCILRSCKQISKNYDNIPEHINKTNILLLNKAQYGTGIDNNKHEQLNTLYYTHFSSPIRRYIDIVVHRMYYSALMNDGMIYNNNNIVKKINNQLKIIKKISKQDKLLDLIFDIEYNYNSVLNTSGIIVDIDDNKIMIYIEEFNIFVNKKIFVDKLKGSVNYESNDYSIMINNVKLNLFDIVRIDLVTSIKAIHFRNKLMINIIEPNIIL